MRSLLTAATFAVGLGLALPAYAQTTTPQDPGQTSPLAQRDGGQSSPLAQRDPGQESPLAQRDPGQSSPLAQNQDCPAMWKRTDLNNDGVLADKELDKLRSVLTAVDIDKDGKISQAEFTSACQKGSMRNVQL